MPASRHRFSCFHVGFGAYCHRCKQAEDLESKAKTLTSSPVPEGKTKKDVAEEVQKLLGEAKRLKGTKKQADIL